MSLINGRVRKVALVVGGAVIVTASLALGSSTAIAAPLVGARIASTGSGCPAGTQTLVPDKASLATFGARALVPAGVAAADPTASSDPVLQKMAALNATWVTTVQCDVLDRSAGSAVPTESQAAAASSASAGAVSSYNWAGYLMDHPNSGQSGIAHSSMEWTLGKEAASGPTDTDISESDWPGIGTGSFSGDTLIQAGSDIERGKIANGVVPFYELYPQENEVVIKSLPVVQNTAVHYLVDVQYDPKANTAYFNVCEANKCASISQKLSGSSRYFQAEWIRERPSTAGVYHPLASTSTETFTSAGGSGYSGSTTVGFTAGSSNTPASRLYKYVMKACNGNTMVTPGAISTSGNFSTTVAREGIKESC